MHIPGAPEVHTFNNAFTEHPGVTGSHTSDTVIGQINFVDPNAGDLPTVKAEFSSFAYQDAHHNDIKASLSPHEQAAIAAIEAISVEQNPGNQNTGSATWTYSYPDGAFDFLGAGEILTLTYTAVVNNNYAPNPEINRTQTFTVTITGTNDVPVITSSIPQTIAFVGGTSVPGGDLTAHVPTSGTLTFDDPDLTDTHTVSVKLLLDGLNLPPAPLQILENALTASIKTDSTGTGVGTVNWKLADLPVYLADFVPKGETINLVYAVTVTDSQGATVTQDITVTITGTDTPAVVWIATTAAGQPSGGLWSNAANWETGTVPTADDDAIVITNQLIGLTPSYPVTIDAPAEAKSLTMNDFGTSPPEVINESTLTIGGALDMSADSILHNSGTIRVGGLMEVLDSSVVVNSGALILQQGGDFKGQSTITNTNTGSIEISGGTLNVQVGVTNEGTITVDPGAVLTIGIATITGGAVTNDGTLVLNGSVSAVPPSPAAPMTGTAALTDGTLNNAGVLYAETGAVLDSETVTNTGTIEVRALGALTLDDGTSVANTGGTITVDGTATLTLNDATISGGTLGNSGTVDIEGSSGATLDGVAVTGSGHVQIDVATNGATTSLILEDGTTVTGGTLTVGSVGILDVKTAHGATLDDVGITNDNAIEVFGASTLTLDDGTSVTNTGGTITVDATATLKLNDATISGGALGNSGTIDIERSSGATLDGVAITGFGHIQIDVATNATTSLILEDGTTVTGGTLTVGSVGILDVKTAHGATLDDVGVTNDNSIEVFGGSTLTLDDATSVTNTGGTITVDATAALTLNGATINGGTINDQGSIHVTGSSAIDGATVTGGAIGIDGNQTLKLDNTTLDSASIVAASGSTIQVDEGDRLTLSGVTVNGGTLVNGGTVHVTGNTSIESALVNGGLITIDASQVVMLDGVTISGSTVTNSGKLTVASNLGSSGATLDHVGITSSAIEVVAATTLTLDDGTSVTNNGIITVDGTGTLTLNDASIAGGTINDYSTVSGNIVAGDIDVTGSSTISNAQLNNGQVTLATHQTLTLDNDTVTGTSFADTASGAIIQIDGGTILTLNGVTINGGTIDDYSAGSGGIIAGDIDVAGSSTIGNAALNNGQVTLRANQTLTLNNDKVNGTSFVDTANAASIHIEGRITLDGVAVTGGTIANTNATLTVDAGQTLTLQGGVTVTGGTLGNSGTVDIEGASGAILDGVTVTGSGHIQIDGATNVTTPLILEDGTTITGGTLTVGLVGILDIKTAGGATLDDVGVTNSHSIEVFGGSGLTLDDGTSVTNNGIITVDGTGTLTLNDASIAGGTINDYSTASGSIVAGDIDVTGSSTISNAALNNGHVTLSANQTLTLDSDTVTGTSFVDTADGAVIQIDGDVTLDGVAVTGGTIANTNATLTVDAGHTLTLQGGVTVTGGTLSNAGTVDIEGASGATLDGVTVTGSGTIQVDGVVQATTPLVLLDDTTITSGELKIGPVGVLDVESPDGATLNDVAVTNGHLIEIFAGSALALVTATAVDNTGGIVAIDGTATLTLNDARIDGGTINDYSTASGSIVAGDIDVIGSSTIGHAQLNNGQITIAANQTLTLDSDTVTGTSFIDTAGGAVIQIDGDNTLDGVAVTGGAIANTNATLTVDAGQTLTLQGGVTVTDGTLSNSGTVDIEDTSGAILDGVTVTGSGHIQIDGATNVTTPLILEDGTTITGGTLTVGSVGVLDVKTSDGATLDDVGVTNSYSIEVFGGSTLTLDDGTSVTNGEGTITVDGAGTLTLNNASIDGGTIDAYSTESGSIIAGDIDVTGSSTISNAQLTNGQVTLGANQTLTLDNDKVNGTSFVDTANAASIHIEGSVTLDGVAVTGGTIANTNATLTVDAGDTLTLQGGVTVTGGTLSNAGTVDIEGASGAILDGVTVTGSGHIQIDGATNVTTLLILEDGTTITGGTLTVGSVGVLDVKTSDGATLDDVGVTNSHSIEVFGGSTLTLDDGTSVTNGEGAVTVDGTGTLTLNDASIDGGTIDAYSTASGSIVAGDIDVAGSSTISNAALNNGHVTLSANQTLTLDGDTVTGTSFTDTADGAIIQVDGNTTLKLDHASIDGGTINDFSTVSGAVVAGDIDIIGSSTISNASLNHGNVSVEDGATLTLDGDTLSGTAFSNVATGSIIQLGGEDALNGVTITDGEVHIASDALVRTSGDVALTNTTVTNDGTIEVTGGTLKISGSIADSSPDGSGSIKIDSHAVLEIDGSDTQNVVFAGANGELQIDGSGFGGSISGLATTDQIDLRGISFGADTTGGYSGGVLTITDGSNPPISMTLVGDYTDAHFASVSDGHGGTLITLNPNDDAPSFAAGDTSESATVTELANTTGSSALDPSPAAGGTLHFTDIDLTDRPTAITTQTVSWTDGTTDLSLSLTPDEISALESAFSLTQSGNTNNGALGWTYQISDNALDVLGTNETATVKTTVTLDDHQGGTDTAVVTININGANDVPTVSATSGGLAELAGVTGGTATDTATGTISFADADIDDHPVVTTAIASSNPFDYKDADGNDLTSSLTMVQLAAIAALESGLALAPDSANANTGTVGWTYSVADSALDFMAAGETLTLNYTATVNDQHGGVAATPITVTIAGSDDAPLLTADTSGSNGTGLHAIDELAGKIDDLADIDSASGSLSFTDVDLADTHTLSHGGPTYAWSGGSLTTAQVDALTAAGQLTLSATDSTHTGTGSISFGYSAADSSFDFLAEGQTLTVSYGITVNDNHSASSSQPVTFTITGSNDAPVVDTHGAALGYVENQAPTAIAAGLTLSDIDSPTLGSANVRVFGNFVAGEDVLGFTDQNGIHGSYDATTGELTLTGTSSVANYQAALASVTYFDNSDNPSDAPRTVSFSVDDGATANSHSNVATAVVSVTPVDDAPVLNSMTLTIAEGGTTVLTNDDFSVTDPDSSSFLYTVNNPTGGQFEVFNGDNWVGAQTGGFTTAQIAAGQVEFVQDGTSTTPDFSIFVSDGTDVSAPISPTVNFSPTLTPFVWASDVSGAWSNSANWSTGVIPGTTDHAEIGYGDIAVTIPSASMVGSLASAATLDIANDGSLSISGKGGDSSNVGVIDIYGTMTLNDATLNNTDGSSDGLVGAVVVENGGTLTINNATIADGALTDNGIIVITGSSTISGGSISSNVSSVPGGATPTYTWVDGTSGDWGTASDWSGGVVPDGKSNATIGGSGTETVTVSTGEAVNMLTLNDANATLAVTNGATLSVYGGFAVTAAQAIDITQGTLVVGGGAVTLDNTTIELGGTEAGPPGITGFPAFSTYGTLQIQLGTALTIGPHATLDVVAGQIYSSGSLDNEGTIVFSTQGGTAQLYAYGGFDNEGSIIVENGDTFTLSANSTYNASNGSFSPPLNNGTISVGSGGDLIIQGVLAGSGNVVIHDGGTLEVEGTLSDTVSFAAGGVGTLEIDPTFGSQITGTVTGLALGDAIDFAHSTITSFVISDDALSVTLASGQTDNINLGGPLPSGTSLQIQLDGHGGQELTLVDGLASNPGSINVGTGQLLTLDRVTLSSVILNVSATLTVEDGTTITAGTLTIASGSAFAIVYGESDVGATLDGVTVDIADITGAIAIGTTAAATATLTLQGGTTVTGGTITINDGSTLDIEYGTGVFGANATLDQVAVANSGTVQVGTDSDDTATLTLEDGTTIIGGTLTINSDSTLAIAYGEGDVGATLDGVSVGNSGTIQVGTFDEDPTLKLDDGTSITGGTLSIGNESTLEIDAGPNGGATLHDVTVYIADSSSTIAVSDGATLTLNDVFIYDGVINDYSTASGDIVPGDIDVTGSSSISYASLNDGNVTVEADQTLTLDGVSVTGTTFDVTASGATIQIDGDQTLTLSDATINGGTIDAYSTASGSIIAGDIDVTGSSTLSNASLNHAYVTVASGQTLTLSEVTIAGGTIDDHGIIDVTGSSTISDASLSHGNITIEDGQTLTLDNVTVTDTTISFAGSGTLKLGQPSLFSGSIGGISGSGDVLDLGGFDAAHDHIVASTGEGSYNGTSNTTVLLVTDETSDHSVTLTLDGDYSNSSWTVTDDQHGGANIVDPPAAKPAAAATIASDMSLEISSSASSAENVTFQSSTGSLTLDHPSSFTGVVSGFTGDGTLAGSDQIDLKGIDYHSSAFTESFDAADDTLDVSDGTHSALLHFNGIYQAANFNFTTDNQGGTIVYDPPVSNGASAGGNTAPVTATGHGFVFNFAQNGQDAAAHPAGDTHLFDGQTFVNAETNVNKLQDEGHANLAAASEAVELPSVAAIKAQMHAHDFHFA